MCRGRLAEDRDENRDEICEVATHEAGTLRVNERKSMRACRAGGSKVTVCVAQSFSSIRLSLIGRCIVTVRCRWVTSSPTTGAAGGQGLHTLVPSVLRH
jgi:hypothetical protein